jgi:glycosyltransferase involved in cell wall biosynthesis
VIIGLENEPYPYDRRVRQEAEALVAAGYDVTVCGPTGFGYDAAEEEIDGVRVLRCAAPPEGSGALGYLREYLVALPRLWMLMRRAARERPADAVVVCCPPDAMVLPALPLRRRGAALIFDHHDLSPELFEAKFGRRGPLHEALLRLERFALRAADVVIATNDSYAAVARERCGVDPGRVFVVRNAPDPARIHPVEPDPALRDGHEHLVCWVGVMSAQEGLGVLIDAADVLVRGHGRTDVGFVLVGPGDARRALEDAARARGLDGAVRFTGPVGDDLLRRYMATADVCVSVDEPTPMNELSTMTKVVEYMTMGRPVVQFPLLETGRTCGDATAYARAGDPVDLARRIEELLDDRALAQALGAAARDCATASLLWPQQAPVLLDAVATALRLRRSGSPQARQERDSHRRVVRAPTAAAAIRALFARVVRPLYVGSRRLLVEGVFERRAGISTGGVIPAEDLFAASEHRVGYQPTGWLKLWRILRPRDVAPTDVFADIGSGKGRVVFQAARRYPFARVLGVELSEQLNEIARRNIERNRRRLRCPRVELVTADVLSYRLPDDVTVVYFANPFTGPVFQAAVDELLASLERRPRRLRVIYSNPVEEQRLLAAGFRCVRAPRALRPTAEWARSNAIRMYERLPA